MAALVRWRDLATTEREAEHAAATRMQNAIEKVVNEGKYVTPDLNPNSSYGTQEMGRAIIDAMV